MFDIIIYLTQLPHPIFKHISSVSVRFHTSLALMTIKFINTKSANYFH